MNTAHNQHLIFTLDAGGTTLAFTAMQAAHSLGHTIVLPSQATTLSSFLDKLLQGFGQLQSQHGQPQAISFAFPGPADYPNGIIGDLENLPLFRGGVPLAAFLQQHFHCPVYINNDGDLFALGEAIGGFLPHINAGIEAAKSRAPYRSLMGITLGTGLGGGIVQGGELWQGENSAGGEINRFGNPWLPHSSLEDSLSIRAVRRAYAQAASIALADSPQPHEIYKIATGQLHGHSQAAKHSFHLFAQALAHLLGNMISMCDAPVVIGGGLSGAHSLFLQPAVALLQKPYRSADEGNPFARLEVEVYNAENEASWQRFLGSEEMRQISVPGTAIKQFYNPHKAVVVGVSKLGTDKAVALGAWAFAVRRLG